MNKQNREDPYDRFLEREFDEMGARVIDYTEIPHRDVVARDLRRARPFQQSGKGYRDTLLWETMIRNCVRKGAVTVFITKNSADFCDAKGQLHEHLKTDIRRAGVNETDLKLFKDLVQFTDSLVVPFLKARKDFALLVSNKKVDGLSLEQVCEENIDTIVEATDRSPSIMVEDPGTYEPSVDVVAIPRDFEITSASEITDDRLLVTFKFRASVSFTFFLQRSEYACMTDEETGRIQIVDSDWNESVMQVESDCEIDVRCRLTFDTAGRAVESFEVEGVGGV